MSSNKPLEGYKVVDFSAVFAGPLCARYLLDCGADVVKVETPNMGDLVRGIDGNTQVFAHFNAGKKSIAINLKEPKGQAIARQLVMEADIVVENFRPGIMAKFGLDYASLKEDRPDLIYCSISGFGQSGPMVNRAAYAPIVHASSGFDHVHAIAQGQDSVRPSSWDIMVADILTGSYAFSAIQTALIAKERFGRGEHIDVSMMESMMSLIPAHIQGAQQEEPAVIGRFHPVKAADGYFMLCAVSNKNLECLAEAIDRPDLLTDPRFVRGPRTANFYLLVAEVETWSLGRTVAECEAQLNKAGVPCSSYQKVEDLFTHPQVLERESFSTISDEGLGEFLIQNMPFKFAGINNSASTWVPSLGQHTDEVLLERLSLSDSDVTTLRDEGVVS